MIELMLKFEVNRQQDDEMRALRKCSVLKWSPGSPGFPRSRVSSILGS